MSTPEQDIQPFPVPLTFKTTGMRLTDGAPTVVLQILSPTGTAVYFLPADFARQMGANMIDHANKAKALAGGLIVPEVVLHRENGHHDG